MQKAAPTRKRLPTKKILYSHCSTSAPKNQYSGKSNKGLTHISELLKGFKALLQEEGGDNA